MLWSKLLSLCPEVQTHTGSTVKVSQGKDFPPAPKEDAPELCHPHLCPQHGPALPMSPGSGDTLETAQHLTGWWLGAAPAPGCAPCIPGAAPASAREFQQGKAALDPSGFATRALSMGGCAHSTWGLHSHALPAFPLGFVLLFNQPNSLLGASTPAIEAGGSGEGGGCLAPMSTGCPGAALEFDGRSCRLYCSSRVWFGL